MQQDGRYKTWKMKIWLEVFFVLLLVGVCLALITENRHPVKTLAWILLLVFVPGVGLVLDLGQLPAEDRHQKRPGNA